MHCVTERGKLMRNPYLIREHIVTPVPVKYITAFSRQRGKQQTRKAWVAKGTLPNGKDHAWVLTFEAEGWITFWEACQARRYHLPGRHTPSPPGNPTPAKKKYQSDKLAQKQNQVQNWQKFADEKHPNLRAARKAALKRSADFTRLPVSPHTFAKSPSVPYETIESTESFFLLSLFTVRRDLCTELRPKSCSSMARKFHARC